MGAVLAAPPERLGPIANDPIAVDRIISFRKTMLHALRATIADQPVLSDWQTLLDYLNADMRHRLTEAVRVLFLDTRNRLIKDEVMWTGTIDASHMHVREVIMRALEVGAAALIVVHNHPSGNPAPSQADISVTRALAAAGKVLNIAVHDHLIIGATEHTSMRCKGLL